MKWILPQLLYVAMITMLSFSASAQNKVVVIPMFGNEAMPLEPEPISKIIFVTNRAHNGNFGGPKGADAFCQEEAERPGSLVQEKQFKAWIFGGFGSGFDLDSTTIRTFKRSSKPYQLLSGDIVALNYDLLISGSPILEPINIDQFGGEVPRDRVWTGLGENGTERLACLNWTNASGAGINSASGIAGNPYSEESWSNFAPRSCDALASVYCFEQ